MALSISGSSPSFTTYQGGVITSGTSQASTSGTSIDFTSIPSWVKRITVMFNGVSTTGTSAYLVQIGAGSITSSGYTGSVWTASANYSSSASGVLLQASAPSAANAYTGIMRFNLQTSNTWVSDGILNNNTSGGSATSSVFTGTVALAGTLDRVRITTVNGTDTFDAGSINILYE
jgi:hypothetical protein